MFVFPSLPEGEGMPGVLIEAGLSGLPVVATDVPGVRSVVEDGVTGSVVGIQDMAALCDHVCDLLEAPERRKTMGDAARSRCESKFGMQVVRATLAGAS